MKKLLLLPLFAVACASSPDYARGAYTPRAPPAPTFSPTQDAPHTKGQPGHVGGRGVSRSANRRHVAPSARPQMVAADGDARRTVELMLQEPAPSATLEGIEAEAVAICWADILKMLNAERDLFLSFSPQEVRCLRHIVLAHCGARQNEKRAKRDGKKYDPAYEHFMASQAGVKACGKRGEFMSNRVTDPYRRFTRHGDDVLGWRP